MSGPLDMIRVTVRDAGQLLAPCQAVSSPILSVILSETPLTEGELLELPDQRKVEVVEAGNVIRDKQWSQTVRVVSL